MSNQNKQKFSQDDVEFEIDYNTQQIKITNPSGPTFTTNDLHTALTHADIVYGAKIAMDKPEQILDASDIQNAFLHSLADYLNENGVRTKYLGIHQHNSVKFEGTYAIFTAFCYAEGDPEGFLEVSLKGGGRYRTKLNNIQFSYADPGVYEQILKITNMEPAKLKDLAKKNPGPF
jgi:hypothetical protein